MLWINELHYDDDSTDENEGGEIAGTAGTNLDGYTIIGIRGATSATYDTDPLSGTIPGPAGGARYALVRHRGSSERRA